MSDSTVPARVLDLAAELAKPKAMRRGSVSERYIKCHKPGCQCGDRIEARHGPYFSVSRVVKGKTKSRWLDAEQAEQVRQQVEAGRRFRKDVEAYWEACEQWADAELEGSEENAQSAAKKRVQGGVRPRNHRRD